MTAGFLAAATAFALAGCAATTYGTGVSPARQTITDLAGIASLGEKKEPIDYEPRPPVVAPPDVAALPPPGVDNTTTASNWPVDPDEQAQQLASREKQYYSDENLPLNSKDPDFRGLAQAQQQPVAGQAMTEKEREELAMKLYADARGAVAVDEYGNPVRRYLSDPPSDYRIPDPDSPVEIVDKKKKKRKFRLFGWWASDGDTESTDTTTQ